MNQSGCVRQDPEPSSRRWRSGTTASRVARQSDELDAAADDGQHDFNVSFTDDSNKLWDKAKAIDPDDDETTGVVHGVSGVYTGLCHSCYDFTINGDDVGIACGSCR